MPAPRTAVSAGALAALLLLSGCGKTDEEKVRDTLQQLQAATAARDYRGLCEDVLAESLVKKLDAVGLPCEIALRNGFGSTRRPAIHVQRVKVRGDTAFAVVTATAAGQRPERETIRLVKEDDDWRVAALARAQPPAPGGQLK